MVSLAPYVRYLVYFQFSVYFRVVSGEASYIFRAHVFQGLLLSRPSQRLSAGSIYLKQFRRMSLHTAVVKSLVNLTHSIKYSCFTEKCVLFVYS